MQGIDSSRVVSGARNVRREPLAFRVRDGAGGIDVGPRVLHGCLAALTHKAHFLLLIDYIRRYTARNVSVYPQPGPWNVYFVGLQINHSDSTGVKVL